MKRILTTVLLVSMALFAKADDKPVTFDRIPVPAQTFVKKFFPNEKVALTTVDDDLVRPDYEVTLSDGTKMDFDHSGKLKNVESRQKALPEGIVPVQICKYVKDNHPDAYVLEYEVQRRGYEIRLSTRFELHFNSNFQLIEIDD
jgi:hypothetical protein